MAELSRVLLTCMVAWATRLFPRSQWKRRKQGSPQKETQVPSTDILKAILTQSSRIGPRDAEATAISEFSSAKMKMDGGQLY